MNPSVFAGRSVPAPSQNAEGLTYDSDGVTVPPTWHTEKRRRTWDALGIEFRRRHESYYLAEIAKAAAKRPARAYQGTYSTAYAKDLCRERGWRVIQSEHRDRFGNLHDCYAGSDVVALRPDRTQVLVQGGCQGSRAEHRRRFEERKDQVPLGATFLYVEFKRDGALTLEEQWA